MRVDQKGCTHRASDRCTRSFQASRVTHDYLTANRLRPRRSIIGRASAIPAFTPTPAHPSGRVKGAWKRANGRNDHPANSLTAPGPRVARRPTGIAECPRHHASRMQCRPMQISTWTGVRRQASATSSINHVVSASVGGTAWPLRPARQEGNVHVKSQVMKVWRGCAAGQGTAQCPMHHARTGQSEATNHPQRRRPCTPQVQHTKPLAHDRPS